MNIDAPYMHPTFKSPKPWPLQPDNENKGTAEMSRNLACKL